MDRQGGGGAPAAAGVPLHGGPASESERRAVLCLHGFSGTPFEVKPIADELTARGYRVDSPVLAGHGSTVAALGATGWRDWLRSAEEAFDALAARTAGRVAVVGFSTGGLLALRLARSRPDRVAALAALSVPLRLHPAQERGIRFVGRLPRLLLRGPLRAIPKLFGSQVGDQEMRRANPTLRAMPFSCLQSLLELMATVGDDLPHIRASTLVVHGRKDRTVPIASSVELAKRLTASLAAAETIPPDARPAGGPPPTPPRVESLWLERSWHLVGIDVERNVLNDAIGQFFAERARW